MLRANYLLKKFGLTKSFKISSLCDILFKVFSFLNYHQFTRKLKNWSIKEVSNLTKNSHYLPSFLLIIWLIEVIENNTTFNIKKSQIWFGMKTFINSYFGKIISPRPRILKPFFNNKIFFFLISFYCLTNKSIIFSFLFSSKNFIRLPIIKVNNQAKFFNWDGKSI